MSSHPISAFTVGSAVSVNKCAKGVVLPKDFMSAAPTNPLPPAGGGAAGTSESVNWVTWAVGAAVVGGIAYWALTSGVLPFANPSRVERVERYNKQWSASWERAYREALRAGFKPGEASEYAYEVIQAQKERGELVSPARSSTGANPSVVDEDAIWDRAYRQARDSGASTRDAEEFANEQVEADRAARFNAGDSYGNPRKSGGAEASVIEYAESYARNRGLKAEFPRLVVGMMAELDGWPVRNADGGGNIAYFPTREAAEASIATAHRRFKGELRIEDVKVGDVFDYFGDTLIVKRVNKKSREVWFDAFKEGRAGRDAFGKPYPPDVKVFHISAFYQLKRVQRANPSNPGRAQKEHFTRADADPEQLRLGIKHELEHTDSRKVAERIALDHLAEDSAYYEHLDAMERSVFRGNPTRAEHYRAAADAGRRTSSLIAAARKARGSERLRLLDEAEAHLRKSVDHQREAGDTWVSYESSSGREQIEALRAHVRLA